MDVDSMLKELLSDFSIIIHPSEQPNSFQPYFSTILTIITITVVVYGFQTLTTHIYAYAHNPGALKNKVTQTFDCKDLSIFYLCEGAVGDINNNLQSVADFSLEQDLQSPIN